jgi:hypothetical protein
MGVRNRVGIVLSYTGPFLVIEILKLLKSLKIRDLLSLFQSELWVRNSDWILNQSNHDPRRQKLLKNLKKMLCFEKLAVLPGGLEASPLRIRKKYLFFLV